MIDAQYALAIGLGQLVGGIPALVLFATLGNGVMVIVFSVWVGIGLLLLVWGFLRRNAL